MENFSLRQLIKNIKNNPALVNLGIPLEYNAGYPVLQIKNSMLCVRIPYLRYKITGKIDKTLVYPVKYVVTVALPQGKIVSYDDLSYKDVFEQVDFSQPVGLFRHDAVKSFNKSEFDAKKSELFAMYDKIINCLLNGEEYSDEDDEKFRELLNIMLEPSLKPIYKVLDKDFYEKYLS